MIGGGLDLSGSVCIGSRGRRMNIVMDLGGSITCREFLDWLRIC